MARWFGIIGFSTDVETDPENRPSVYEAAIIEKQYYGEITKKSRRWEGAQYLNDNLQIVSTIIIYADPYLTSHIGEIKYVRYLGNPWKVVSAEYDYPRVTLTLGGLYNEQTT